MSFEPDGFRFPVTLEQLEQAAVNHQVARALVYDAALLDLNAIAERVRP